MPAVPHVSRLVPLLYLTDIHYIAKSNVVTEMPLNTHVLCEMKLFCCASSSRRFDQSLCFHFKCQRDNNITILRNVGNYVANYKAPQRRRPKSSHITLFTVIQHTVQSTSRLISRNNQSGGDKFCSSSPEGLCISCRGQRTVHLVLLWVRVLKRLRGVNTCKACPN
jgi:hypothetical protein